MTTPGASLPGKQKTERRSVWVAALFSLITPGLGQLYNGMPKRALVAAGLVLGMHAVILGTALLPPAAPEIGYLNIVLRGFGWLLVFVILLDAAIGARRIGAVELRRFNHPAVYLLVAGAWFAEYYLFNEVHDEISATRAYVATAGSMEPTLEREDRVLGYNGYYRVHDAVRGDVVAVRNPGDQDEVYLLRVIGLPRDRIQMENGILILNGEVVPRRMVEDKEEFAGGRKAFSIHAETLPGGITYRISEQFASGGFADNIPEKTVPAGSVYLLGDNRDKATDSRFFGPIPINEIESRLTYIFWSREDSRIGMAVQPEG